MGSLFPFLHLSVSVLASPSVLVSVCNLVCLAQFLSDSCLSGLVLFASLVRFTLAISNTTPYRFPQELLHLVTIPGRPPLLLLQLSPPLSTAWGDFRANTEFKLKMLKSKSVPLSLAMSRHITRALSCLGIIVTAWKDRASLFCTRPGSLTDIQEDATWGYANKRLGCFADVHA